MLRVYTHGIVILLSSQLGNSFQVCQRGILVRHWNAIDVVCSRNKRTRVALFGSSSSTSVDVAESMRAGEIKKELESYGISTKSFFEKSELVVALLKARSEGLQPKQAQSSQAPTPPPTPAPTPETKSSSSNSSREDRIAAELDTMSSMKATDMKKELQSAGVSTSSFFEKSEFAKALACARVDGVTKEEEEEVQVEVEVLPKGDPGPQKRSTEQPQQQQTPSNPFGGGGGGGIEDMLKNMGGMAGGMGGMTDMLKNMGGGMGGGGMPGGGGGMPGGMPDMAKVQQMMQNPKIKEIMAKAQSNPKIMSAVMECMSNPLALAKYQNDPEIKDLINEIKPYL